MSKKKDDELKNFEDKTSDNEDSVISEEEDEEDEEEDDDNISDVEIEDPDIEITENNDQTNVLSEFNLEENIFETIDPESEIKMSLRVPDEDRICKPTITKYEIVRMIGTRAKQLSENAKVMLKYSQNNSQIKSSEDQAKLELKQKVIPIIIKRPLPNNKYEHWRISELDLDLDFD